jgi:hypothetical protein
VEDNTYKKINSFLIIHQLGITQHLLSDDRMRAHPYYNHTRSRTGTAKMKSMKDAAISSERSELTMIVEDRFHHIMYLFSYFV